MKKLSAVQLKQQALVFSVADSLEAQALEELNGMQQCWFDVQYHQFPGSLLLRFQFENVAAIVAGFFHRDSLNSFSVLLFMRTSF